MIPRILRQRLFWAALIWLAPALMARAVFINGQNYVPLSSWARSNGLNGYTLNRGDEIILTNRNNMRLEFHINSAEVEINGVDVRLSFPVAGQKGVPLISQLDIDTAIRPLLYPQKSSTQKITTICLDPGHGGKDTGNRVGAGYWAHNEKTYTLALAQELRSQLTKAGFRVVLTRNSDTFIPLPDRPMIANRVGADLFISLHFNATQTGRDTVAGPETYCITPVGAASSNSQGEGADHGPTTANRVQDKSLLLAYQIQKSLVRNLFAPDRDVRRARFAVLRDATMPAILIEGGYMTNPFEGKKIYDFAYRKQMASAIVKAILDYQKIAAPVYLPTPSPAPKKVSPAKKTK